MAEKLQVILHQPELVIDWWSGLGGGAALLAQAYPKAQRVLVEPDAVWARAAVNRRSGPGVVGRALDRRAGQRDERSRRPGAGLVWANMMLHAIVDPTALIAQWQRLLRVDGFVMFSCLGPGTLRELREL